MIDVIDPHLFAWNLNSPLRVERGIILCESFGEGLPKRLQRDVDRSSYRSFERGRSRDCSRTFRNGLAKSRNTLPDGTSSSGRDRFRFRGGFRGRMTFGFISSRVLRFGLKPRKERHGKKNGVQINMALVQNLLDFTPGYSFCDINRAFAYQNRAESSLEGRAKNRRNNLISGPTDGTVFPFLKKRRHIQSHDAD